LHLLSFRIQFAFPKLSLLVVVFSNPFFLIIPLGQTKAINSIPYRILFSQADFKPKIHPLIPITHSIDILVQSLDSFDYG